MPAFSEPTVQTLAINKEFEVAASAEILYASILEELGPAMTTPEGPMPMKLEAWPGGRWYRDLGNNTGHLWGHVQVIKPGKLIELIGPMFMSFPALSHMTYRITANGNKSLFQFTHRVHGAFPKEFGEGMGKGWEHILGRIRVAAERNAKR